MVIVSESYSSNFNKPSWKLLEVLSGDLILPEYH